MIILDGKLVSQNIEAELAEKVSKLANIPALVIIQVGDNLSSNTYIKKKVGFGKKIGVPVNVYKYDESITAEMLLEVIDFANKDESIGGIIVQLPLPEHIDKEILINAVDPEKDVDGLGLASAGKLVKRDLSGKTPATPTGVVALLEAYHIELTGKNIVVIGRSQLTGLSMALLLIAENATVTIAHSGTKDLKEVTSRADILISAIGKPHFIKADFIKENAVIVDIGTTPVETEEGIKLAGDVDFEDVKDKALAVSPVPGGVGPMTVASLFVNLLKGY
jgi:methylenetetrahydrofolate dehydrogenase (NADP+)/methenyltetrahydrofolate cyclohydrolase